MASFTEKMGSCVFLSQEDLGHKTENIKASSIPSARSPISHFISELLAFQVTSSCEVEV